MFNRESRLFIESYEHDDDLLDDRDLIELQEAKSPLEVFRTNASPENENNNN